MATGRRAIWERDGGVCGICRQPVALEVMHLDHITPVSLGGASDETNLRPTHPKCNIGRGNGRVPRTAPSPRRTVDKFARLPRSLVAQLEQLAHDGYRSFTAQVILMLEQWLEEHAPQLEREKKRTP